MMPSLGLTTADRDAAARWLGETNAAPGFVALAPGSIWGSKRWPYFADLAGRLAARAAIVLVGGPDDVALAMEIQGAVPALMNACGALTLRQSAALIEQAAVLVTNDSAPLHFAQAVGTPTVAIFGPTVPAFGFGPRGPRDRTVGVDDLACRPCSPHGPAACPLGHHSCMQSLAVEAVLRAIEETDALHRRG
jgi:heptosyltransferase-2